MTNAYDAPIPLDALILDVTWAWAIWYNVTRNFAMKQYAIQEWELTTRLNEESMLFYNLYIIYHLFSIIYYLLSIILLICWKMDGKSAIATPVW